jgi:hypothetical protein
MEVVGYVAVIVVGLLVLLALGFVVVALPDVSRYRRLRKM